MKTETILGMTYHICKSQDDINECPDSAKLKLVGEWGNVELNRNFGNIYVSGTAQVGDISVYSTAQVGYISVYGTVKGNIYVYGTVKDNIYVSGTVKGYNIGGETNIQLVDGYLFKTGRTSKRKGFTIRKGSTLKSVVDGKWIGEDGYVAEKDGFTAHGNTATQAISDCHFKILQRDFTGEPITLDTMMDIKTWRLYSGACESMSLEFCKQHAIDPNKQHRLGDVMPILEANNAYGLDRLKDFLA